MGFNNTDEQRTDESAQELGGTLHRMDALRRIVDIRVSEAMHRHYGTVSGDLSPKEVLALMIRRQWHEVIVTDRGRTIGLITRPHLMRMSSSEAFSSMAIKEACIAEPLSTNADTPLLSARNMIRSQGISCLPVRDGQGDIVGVLTAQDVCNGFSSKLQTLGEHMYAIMENIVEAIQVVNSDGIVTFWNNGSEKIYGLSASEILGRPIGQFFPDDLLLDVINNGTTYRNHLTELRPGFFAARNAAPVSTADGVQIGAVCTALDVTHYLSLMGMLDAANTKAKCLERKVIDSGLKEAGSFCTSDPETERTLAQARRAGNTNATILITGESGTGKELLAHEIYTFSKRYGRPFVEVNCSAVPESLFESEMFGYEGGSFTGSNRNGKKGKFESANGGTIFFDEIGEMPLDLQAKLLRAIQERRFYRLGGTTPIDVDVRIIAATNRNLIDMVANGAFREDLYYRLSVVRLKLLPLRERRSDIPKLLSLFLKELSATYGRRIDYVDPRVIELLTAYDWPGNVRQLRNILESVIILMEGEEITEQSLIEANIFDLLTESSHAVSTADTSENDREPLDNKLHRHERELIEQALRDNHYNKAETAHTLGIPRATLYYKMRHLGIDSRALRAADL